MFSPIFQLVLFILINQINGGRILLSSSNTNCTIQHGDYRLREGDKTLVNGKLYKVEDCQLQRAYQTCGTHLWFMINIVCEAIDKQKNRNRPNNRYRRFAEEKLLSEACCEHACTILEMTRYCPQLK
jgi:hypothetical protein